MEFEHTKNCKTSEGLTKFIWSMFTRNVRRTALKRLHDLTWYQVLTAVSVVILSGWCFYNVHVVFWRYYQFDTIVSVHSVRPDMTAFPGVTICAPSILTPQMLAKMYPGFRKLLAEFYAKNEMQQMLDNLNTTDKQIRYNTFKYFESLALNNYTAFKMITEKSLHIDDLLHQCLIRPVNIRNYMEMDSSLVVKPIDCVKLKPILSMIYDGRKCFTYFSNLFDIRKEWKGFKPLVDFDDLDDDQCLGDSKVCIDSNSSHTQQNDYSPNKKEPNKGYIFDLFNISGNKENFGEQSVDDKMVYDLNPNIEIQIKMKDSIWNYLGNWNIIITVHPPNILPNKRKFFSFQVARHSIYEVSFTKKITKMLPKPYKTRCINYYEDTIYKKYRTSDECRNMCVKDYCYHKDSCANYFTVLTSVRMFERDFEKQHICPHDQQNYSSYLEAKRYCEDKCPDECEQTLYEITGRVINLINEECNAMNNDDLLHNGRSCYTRVLVKISPKPFQLVLHQPAFTYEEFIGTIGGHLGIWLGMSIYSFVNFSVHFWYSILLHIFNSFITFKLKLINQIRNKMQSSECLNRQKY